MIGTIETEIVDYILGKGLSFREIESKNGTRSVDQIRSAGRDAPISLESPPSQKTPWLGRHRDMSSPGEITLHRDELRRSFWKCIEDLQSNDKLAFPIGGLGLGEAPILRILCQALVYMVVAHERFHHFCDGMGNITKCRGGIAPQYKADWQTEEALATAWEWQEVQRNVDQFDALSDSLREAWIEWWYEGISQEGYKDWKDYGHFCFFKEGVASYLLSGDVKSKLTRNGLHVGDWIYGQLNAPDWYDSAVTYFAESDDKTRIQVDPNDWIVESRSASRWIERKSLLSSFCHQGRRNLNFIAGPGGIREFPGVLCLSGNPIEPCDVTDLLLIDSLKALSLAGLTGKFVDVVTVVNRFLPNTPARTGELVHCADALKHEGLEEYQPY